MEPGGHGKTEHQGSGTNDQEWRGAQGIITAYLLEQVPEFRHVMDLRQQGWDNPEGDVYFQKQREKADRADQKRASYFFHMMKSIGAELQRTTNAFEITAPPRAQPKILDMCVAPGGFLATALDFNPGAIAFGFSLNVSEGGHKVLLRRPNVTLKFLDITMLAADMGVTDIPPGHVDADKFLPRQFDPGQLFDLVICDGQVLRTHPRAAYRENREQHRLMTVQLALGLEHLRPGGTMLLLLHKLEAWPTVSLVRIFNRFSSVKLLKPVSGHKTRSSFYMVARSVQSQHPEAAAATRRWKSTWRLATFGTDEEYMEELRREEGMATDVLEEFGPELVRLGREVWDVQAKALARAPFIKNS